ncbi:OsmC family protein [Nocardia higoensis]|uniref:OsmC family protein n=1 Tax=Nocardia higoensis TaxID=228599 RepID=UPI00030E6765|nr:OsmC family protein [Nocardia higoensis]
MTDTGNFGVPADAVLIADPPGLPHLDNPDPGLREYLSHKREALLAIEAKAESDPPIEPIVIRAHTVAEGRSGVRRIRIRDHQIISDSPPEFAGYDLGPGSPEIQLGVLSSCLTHIFEITAARHRIPLDALRVEVEGEIEPRRGRPGFEDAPVEPHNIRYQVFVTSPAAAEQIDALFAIVEAQCPILALLRNPQSITGTLTLEASGTR